MLTYALRSKVPTLYFSADSDAFTQTSRAVSILMDWDIDEATEAVLSNDLGDAEDALDQIPLRLHYGASPTLADIEEHVEAYFEVYDVFPTLIVIDNVTNVRLDESSDEDASGSGGLESLMQYLADMARQTQACVIGLHHVKGDYNDNDKPIPLSGVKGQITGVPSVVLTLHRQSSEFGPDKLMVSTVKNRGGIADSSGLSPAELQFIGSRMQIRDILGGIT
ncbi:Uncharacterised protein [Nocardia farcinica]|nr:Uncharacterised protein [Nocardia farcinica]